MSKTRRRTGAGPIATAIALALTAMALIQTWQPVSQGPSTAGPHHAKPLAAEAREAYRRNDLDRIAKWGIILGSELAKIGVANGDTRVKVGPLAELDPGEHCGEQDGLSKRVAAIHVPDWSAVLAMFTDRRSEPEGTRCTEFPTEGAR